MLPADRQQPDAEAVQNALSERFSRQLLIVLHGKDNSVVRQHLAKLYQQLDASALIANVQGRVDSSKLEHLRQDHLPYRFTVVDPQTQRWLDNENFDALRKRALMHVLTPVAGGGASLVTDPFALDWFYNASRKNELPVKLDNGWLRLDIDEPAYLLSASIKGNPYNLSLQHKLIPWLEQLKANLHKQNIEMTMSALVFHAAAGAKQARGEVSSIGVISLLGIIVLALIVFRRLSALMLTLLPVVSGCLFAAAITILIYGHIHVITLAFGACLVGVSVDYAFHYLCAAGQQPDALKAVLPGLLIGMISSVVAYGAQTIAPFPGLQQMALFSVFGLIGAWLSVVLWLPHLIPVSGYSLTHVNTIIVCLLRHWPRFSRRQIVVGLIIISSIAVFLLLTGQRKDDIRQLQSSPQSLIAQDVQVQQWLHQSSATRFLMISAPDMQSLLKRQEALTPQLQVIAQHFPGLSFSFLAQTLPSLERQHQTYQQVRKLYQHSLDGLLSTLGLESQADKIRAHLQAQWLTPESWLSSAYGRSLPPQWVSLKSDRVAGIVRFKGNLSPQVVTRLQQLAAQQSDITYVDRITEISSLLSHYRQQISVWVGLAYLLVVLVLSIRYRKRCWIVIAPPLLAGLLSVGIISHVGTGVNLFHVLALLLVLGIGLDMGIFLIESSGAGHTWIAVTLSMLTTLLAFGLLVLSVTPVLHDFGLTVLLGLILIWPLSLTIRKALEPVETV